MMDTVAAALAELGLMPARAALNCNVGITRGDTMWLDVFLRRGFLHVKVSELVSLRDEARTYGEAWRVFRDFMSRPCGYAVRDGWDIFVTEGVLHRSFMSTTFFASTTRYGVAGQVCELFETARVAQADLLPPVDARAAVDDLAERFAGTRYASVARAYQEQGLGDLARLPPAPQHGDFVANNLATRRRRLVVFDWEDFGKVWWPGFDLCTLVMTSLDPGVLAEVRATARPEESLARRVPVLVPACAAIGCTLAEFWRLVPLYLLRFLDLKGTYGNEVRRRVEARLDVLLGTARGAP